MKTSDTAGQPGNVGPPGWNGLGHGARIVCTQPIVGAPAGQPAVHGGWTGGGGGQPTDQIGGAGGGGGQAAVQAGGTGGPAGCSGEQTT